ncbi:MAG: methylenetetrahydromethanopterin dehydrogenase, partial [Hyphomicrobiales bacterium]|nr:methylenetetrahydromethanopterin dehydrogenase [Hyphomicrobiales bacterium]
MGRHAAQVKSRFGADVAAADGSTPEKAAILEAAQVALC